MILCITHSKDFYTIDIVLQALQQAGYEVLRLNSDEFGITYQFYYNIGNSMDEVSIIAGGKKISSSCIEAVWYRKLWNLQVPQELDPAWRNVFTKEYQTYLNIFFNSLQHVPWMNDMQTDHAVGSDKLLQLSSAREAGLTIPETIFTNEAGIIKQFFDQCKGEIIVKLHGALGRSMDGSTPFFPTTKLNEEDLGQLDQLAYCPMIFQEFIAKEYELRIVYVDGEFFTGKIPAEEANATDWRNTTGKTIQWQPYELPSAIKEKIHGMMQKLGLLFGAIDMIKSTSGKYVFLEVNPQGEWGMIQKYLSYPIGETIADKLITRIKNGKEKSTYHHLFTG